MKLKALKRISTKGGEIDPGEIFELEEGAAKRLLELGAAERVVENGAAYSFERELGKLKVDELRHLASIVGVDTEGKKSELIAALLEAIPGSDLADLDGLNADEMREYLGE